ncbi:MAG TPA: lipoprotein [Rubrivivax sp.]|nr:lipoprotein [Rubrivivax sp.]HRY88793.1 lipoprotein [Rubrivivax sp.]HRZ62814.1 lipoprotein [Rubrivivax sp.]
MRRQRAGAPRGATIALLACAAAGCGQKGPLVLPPPAAAASAPAASAAAGAASTPASGMPAR